jgi:hypothetical protein
LAVAALLASCAHPLPPLHATRLIVEERGGGFQPIVHAKVGGKPLAFVLDTGAVESILPSSFAHRSLKRTGGRGDQYLDANGQVFTMFRLPDVPVQFEGEKEAGKIDFMISPTLPDDLGILAPQSLVASGYALTIDLEHGELRYDSEETALKRLRDSGRDPREVDFHRCLIEGFFNKAHRVVAVKINGVESSLIVDSGAMNTVLARNNSALPSMMKTLGARYQGRFVGSVGQGLRVDDVPLEFAGSSFKVRADVLPASQTCGEGLLGADILDQCTLVWGASTLWAACKAR